MNIENNHLLSSVVRMTTISKYYGVCWHAKKQKWSAKIYIAPKTIFLGGYDIEEEAAHAYNIAYEIFGNGFFTIKNNISIGDIRAHDIKDIIIDKLKSKGYID